MSRNARNLLIIGGIIVVALIYRQVLWQILDIPDSMTWFARPLLYIGLYIAWGLSVAYRIVQKHSRRLLITIAVLIVAWWTFRTAKYAFVHTDIMVEGYLWYLFYVPMTLIPQVSLAAVLSIDVRDDESLPKYIIALFVVSAILIVLVLTNDLHNLAFVYPEGALTYETDYTYGPVYYLCASWMGVCAVAMIIVLFTRIRNIREMKYFWLPIVFVGIAVVYAILYVFRVPFVFHIFGDITAVLCALFVGCLESCIQCGLIRANTQYDELFSVSSLGMQIVDSQYRVRYRSVGAPKLKKETMKIALQSPIIRNGKKRIQSTPIVGGYAIWQEDVSDIHAIIHQLEDNKKALVHRVNVEQESQNIQLATEAMKEKNRLYDLVVQQIAPKVVLLEDLIEQSMTAQTDDERQKLLVKAALIGTFIKRKGNLVLLGEASSTIAIQELQLSIEEVFLDLRRLGVHCAVSISGEAFLPRVSVVHALDQFEAFVQTHYERLQELVVFGRTGDCCAELHIDAQYNDGSMEHFEITLEDKGGKKQ